MLMRLSTTAVLAVSLVSVTLGDDQQTPRFRSGIDLVELDVVVLDGDGQVVTDLSRENFEIREDGQTRPIATFVPAAAADRAPDASPRFVVLLLDNLVTDAVMTAKMKEIARMFAGRMSPRDVMAIVPLNGGSGSTSSSRTEVLASIDRYRSSGKSIMGMQREQVLNTIDDLIKQMSSVEHRRKTLVCIGAASVFNPTSGRNFDNEWLDAIGAAARANVALYVIDPNGLTGAHYDGAHTFADETGGAAFVNSNFFERNVAQIWSEAGHYYMLGYEPVASKAKRHDIDVRVKRPGVTVRVRRTRS